jgi:hypothetical protein
MLPASRNLDTGTFDLVNMRPPQEYSTRAEPSTVRPG